MLFKIGVNYSWCKGCGICINYCPKKVYSPDLLGKPVIEKEDECTGCKLCMLRCPDFAIGVYPREEENKSE